MAGYWTLANGRAFTALGYPDKLSIATKVARSDQRSRFFKQDAVVVARRLGELRALEVEQEAAYGRWEELMARAPG